MLFTINESDITMINFKRLIFYAALLVSVIFSLNGQDKYARLRDELNKLAEKDIPQLNEKVNISVTSTPIQEFLRGVANNTGVNINVDPSIQLSVSNNFTDVKVIDVLLFIARQYDLTVSNIGNIININKEVILPTIPTRKPTVNYDSGTQLLSIECENEDLINVAKDIATNTGRNIIPAPGLDRQKVSSFIRNMPIENALDKFAYSNNLTIRKTEDGVFLVEKIERSDISQPSSRQQSGKTSTTKRSGQGGQGNQGTGGNSEINITKINTDSVNIVAVDAAIYDIIKQTAEELNKNYYFSAQIQGNSTISSKAIGFEQLLSYLLGGTSNSFQKVGDIYIIGDNKTGDFKEYRLIQLQNRPVEKLMESIPKELIKDMEIKEFPELNTLYVSGMPERVAIINNFVKSIDKVIPVILIEVMIIEIKKTKSVSTGISAGLGEKPTVTQGTIFPEINMDLSAQSVNNLINSFNGFGTFKIGKVTPNFYMNLKALEDNGHIDIQSTPKLSALNGQEATMTIGNTQYYREQTSNYYGSISSQLATMENYKPVTAELMVKIKPNVSGDDQITLEIEVVQGDFTDRISQYAPPGQVKREFKSLIRVKNQEMVLLGGLEENRKNESGTGVPFLSRIPVVKWLFSSRTNSDSKAKLNIFIKPTIIE
jgi:type IV pilus assembly protein PilQ